MSRGPRFAARTAVSPRRPGNQDRVLARQLGSGVVLLAVADGMGGVSGGALAAETAIASVDGRVEGRPRDMPDLEGLLREAGERVMSRAAEDPALEGMGTTLTVVLVDGSVAHWGHVGDSRLYLLRGADLTQISRDHRFLQDLLDSGDVAPEELPQHPLRNVLDQSLGCPCLAPDHGRLAVREGDVLMLSTDGLHDFAGHEAIRDILLSSSEPAVVCGLLVAAAQQGGSTDDVSVALCRV